jgi:hypothetical protein
LNTRLIELLSNTPQNESIKKILNPILRMFVKDFKFIFEYFFLIAFGSAVVDECLLKAGLNNESCILGKTFNIEQG